MRRIDHARLVLALADGPHTTGSLGSYVAPTAAASEIKAALEELEAGGYVRSAEERSRSGRPMKVYRWSSR